LAQPPSRSATLCVALVEARILRLSMMSVSD
jgi:hypothetical protein